MKALLVRLYQLTLSPAIHWLAGPGFGCRFEPSCSHYAAEAFALHPVHRAMALTVWRILRCQPFCAGGFDPVPRVTNPLQGNHTHGS